MIVQTLDRRFESMPAYNELCEALMPSAPVNTPQNVATPEPQSTTSKWNNVMRQITNHSTSTDYC
jgi:hypothetical protein